MRVCRNDQICVFSSINSIRIPILAAVLRHSTFARHIASQIFGNFCPLAEGMHLLLAAKIIKEMVRREEVVLNNFYYEAQYIYGKLAYKFIF